MKEYMQKTPVDGVSCDAYEIPTSNASLLAIRSGSGMLACGYLKIETAEKLGDALAIVTGVNDFEQMLEKPVVAASSAAAALGVCAGMSGREALICMK